MTIIQPGMLGVLGTSTGTSTSTSASIPDWQIFNTNNTYLTPYDMNIVAGSIPGTMIYNNTWVALPSHVSVYQGGIQYRINDILKSCKNIKFLESQEGFMVNKVVYDVLLSYLKDEKPYAGMTPSEFIDAVLA